MDLTTLGGALMVAFGLLSANALMNSGTIMVDMTVPAAVASDGLTDTVAEAIFERELQSTVSVPSVVPPPEIRGAREKTLAAALANSLKIEDLTFALQMAFGVKPARLEGSVINEKNRSVFIVDGYSHETGAFNVRLEQEPGETVTTLLQRGAVESMWKMQPYRAALYTFDTELLAGRVDNQQERLQKAIDVLPPTPIHPERALLQNLLGISALFENDPAAAQRHFEASAESDPGNIVPLLNLAFLDVYYDRYAEAEAKMKRALLPKSMTGNPILVNTAYTTWAVARYGMRDLDGAEKLLRQALAIYPRSTTAYTLWADFREDAGDEATAATLRKRGLMNSAYFENYAELAILYFEPSWQDGETLKPNNFGRPRQNLTVSRKD